MAFVKSFPRVMERQGKYPEWEEVALTPEEEREQELMARIENVNLIKECLGEANELMKEKNLKPFQTDVVNIALTMFEKRASHNVYWKERKCREKFEVLFNKAEKRLETPLTAYVDKREMFKKKAKA